MKVRVTLKDPDGFYESVHEAAKDGPQEEHEDRVDEANRRLEKWVKYNEYVTVEFDLDAMTAKVVEQR